ncbi:MAG: nuclear transport factor 2 family protein [Caulobacteraceae bacterium]|nr:nuclear transport factor 2 family protein [Caulobacteraceae bacterium]
MSRFHLAGAAVATLMAAALGACNQTVNEKPAADTTKVADAVKGDVAQLVAAMNAHDPAKVAVHDAPDMIAMFHGMSNIVGRDADQAGMKKTFADVPDFHITLVDEAVDVPASGEMAVYRSTYDNSFTDSRTKKSTTLRVNYLAGYKKQADGSWKVAWYVVSDTGAPPAAVPARS